MSWLRQRRGRPGKATMHWGPMGLAPWLLLATTISSVLLISSAASAVPDEALSGDFVVNPLPLHRGGRITVSSGTVSGCKIPSGKKPDIGLELQILITTKSTGNPVQSGVEPTVTWKAETGVWRWTSTVAPTADFGLATVSVTCHVARDVDKPTRKVLSTARWERDVYVAGGALIVDAPSVSASRRINTVHVAGLADCRSLTIYLDDPQGRSPIASMTVPDTHKTDIDVPIGRALEPGPGPHRLYAQCSLQDIAPNVVLSGSVGFVVPILDAAEAPHGSVVASSLPKPQDVAKDLSQRVILVIALTASATLLVGFPAQLFNKTLEENREEIASWLPAWMYRGKPLRIPRGLTLISILALGATLLTAIDGGVRASGDDIVHVSAKTFLAAATAILVTTLLYALPVEGFQRRASGIPANLQAIPIGVVVAALLGCLSIVGNFIPGYVYGLFLTFVPVRKRLLGRHVTGPGVMIGVSTLLGMSLILWPLESLHHGSTSPLQTILAWIVVMGIQSSLFILLPVRFLDGYELIHWSRSGWVLAFSCALFFFFLLEVVQGKDLRGSDQVLESTVTALTLFAGFGFSSVAFWGYFRFRPSTKTTVPDTSESRVKGTPESHIEQEEELQQSIEAGDDSRNAPAMVQENSVESGNDRVIGGPESDQGACSEADSLDE